MKKRLLVLTAALCVLGLAGVAQAMTVTFAWDPNSETDLAGYRMFYRTTAFTSTTAVPAPGTAGWTIVDIPLSSLANPALPEKAVTNIANVTTWFALTAYDNGSPQLQSTFSNVVQVDPPVAAPVIATQPQNVTVNVGLPATFTLTATGTGITYQWQMRTTPTGTWANVSTGTNPSYTTANTVAADNGKQFRCVVTNTGGTATSDIVTLTVNVAPTPPKNIRVSSVN
jgi:hypothetical protein